MSTESTTLSKLTTELAAHLGKELDEPFKRILADKIDSWRSRLLRNSLQEKPLESKFFRQRIYVPLQEVSPIPECLTSTPVPICKVLESTQDIPTPLRFGTQLFDFVGSVDGATSFREEAPGTGDYLRAGKYSRKLVTYSFINQKLRVNGAGKLPMAMLDGVFDKPSEAMRFNCEVAGMGCDYWDQPYPITGDIAQLVVQCILSVDFGRPVTPATKEVDVNPQKQQHEPDGR
jgi:hypothetical protein